MTEQVRPHADAVTHDFIYAGNAKPTTEERHQQRPAGSMAASKIFPDSIGGSFGERHDSRLAALAHYLRGICFKVDVFYVKA